MGGSGDYGGTSNYGGGGGWSDDNIDCSQLSFTATPRLEATADVAIGEKFVVQLAGDRVVELRSENGDLVGTIVDNLINLTACLDSGQAFVATVTALEPAVVMRVAASA